MYIFMKNIVMKKKNIKNGPMYKSINSTPPPQKKPTKKQKYKNSDTQF